MLTDETCDCIAASAYSRSDNGVAHVAAREKTVRNIWKVDGFGGRATLFQRLVPATAIKPEQSKSRARTRRRAELTKCPRHNPCKCHRRPDITGQKASTKYRVAKAPGTA
jgi:hypothetical protein